MRTALAVTAALLAMTVTASANYLSPTGVELSDPGSPCDVGTPLPHLTIEWSYWDVREKCGSLIRHHFGYYFNACTRYAPAIEYIPKVDDWNVTQAFHDDLVKHEDTHLVPGCRDWHG